MDGIVKAKSRGVKFGRKRELTSDKVSEIRSLRNAGKTVPEIMLQIELSRRVYRALGQ